MRKYVFISLLVVFLSGCNNAQKDSIESMSESISSSSTKVSTKQSQPEQVMREQDKLFEKTGFYGSYEIVLDNESKRITLWKKDNVVYYKTIYLKNKNILKIIDTTTNEKEIYSEVL
ncbi:hypothetical protein [Enterococcus gallinarum]|uniref:hypothetical protein n=1 Tax=Enterococcus gallinarum TaxID=1353 RepID=UPI0015C54A45|nr:hypothetical protein [Enterococcus gallinarum]NQE03944.1 hypothetical protein [Enterococcus gallinarum]